MLDFLNYELFSLGKSPVTLLSVLKFVLVFWAGFYLGRLYRKRISKIQIAGANLTEENRTIIANLGYYLIVIGTVFAGLSILGIDLTSLAFIAGAISVGIGFGLQNIVSNFISGIILMFEKSVRIGDLVQLPTGEQGRVREIRMRATTVTTFDNIDILVPNSTFISQNVINLTYQDGIRRQMVPFGVAYGSDVARVQAVVLDKILSSDLIFVRNDPDRPVEVRLTALGASSLDFMLVVYIDAAQGAPSPAYGFHFLPLIYEALNDAGISIPFPQMDLHVKELPQNR